MMQKKIVIQGGGKLDGAIDVGGSKNSALPVMAASILTEDKVKLSNLPHLSDIATMTRLLMSLGMKAELQGHGNLMNNSGKTFIFDGSKYNSAVAEYEIVNKMRASIVVLGPLLARFGEAKVALPGGCAIGTRPIDFHLMAMEKLGAEIKIEQGYVIVNAPNGLKGAEIDFPIISVGATENALMAASLAKGKTVINNAAIEPEITDLVDLLRLMGADITIEDRKITIVGQKKLHGAEYAISADRIQAGSYAVAALAVQGQVLLRGVRIEIFDPIKKELELCGGVLKVEENGVHVSFDENIDVSGPIRISTEAYPGFPTDMQAQFASLLLTQGRDSEIAENIFENRFMYVPELNRMGADIKVNGNELSIKKHKLSGAEVKASDLRASFALIVAGMVAEGETVISDIDHLDRGYEFLETNLANCGIDIKRKLYDE
jgi:UDP-N-acetylglucosamine 1-carboxyvinyltransferase